MSQRRYMLVDLDDTISGSWRREHLIADSWDAFHADLVNDEPIFDMVRLLTQLRTASEPRPYWAGKDWNTEFGTVQSALDVNPNSLGVIALTARPQKWFNASQMWLVKHNVPVDELLMRPDDDYRPSPQVKVSVACERFNCTPEQLKDHVALIIDDHEGVIKAFAGLGITALQIYARRD